MKCLYFNYTTCGEKLLYRHGRCRGNWQWEEPMRKPKDILDDLYTFFEWGYRCDDGYLTIY